MVKAPERLAGWRWFLRRYGHALGMAMAGTAVILFAPTHAEGEYIIGFAGTVSSALPRPPDPDGSGAEVEEAVRKATEPLENRLSEAVARIEALEDMVRSPMTPALGTATGAAPHVPEPC